MCGAIDDGSEWVEVLYSRERDEGNYKEGHRCKLEIVKNAGGAIDRGLEVRHRCDCKIHAKSTWGILELWTAFQKLFLIRQPPYFIVI